MSVYPALFIAKAASFTLVTKTGKWNRQQLKNAMLTWLSSKEYFLNTQKRFYQEASSDSSISVTFNGRKLPLSVKIYQNEETKLTKFNILLGMSLSSAINKRANLSFRDT
jgi:hypothetical protein